MNKILYDNGDLIIVSGANGRKEVFDFLGWDKAAMAHGIYIKYAMALVPVKYKAPWPLVEFCQTHNINMYRSASHENFPAHAFASKKEEFLFNLKFGT